MRRAGDRRQDCRRCIFLFIYFLFCPKSTQYPSNLGSQMNFILMLPRGVGRWPNARRAKAKSSDSDLFACGHRYHVNPDDVSPSSASSPQRHAFPEGEKLVSNLLVFIWGERPEDKKNTNRREREISHTWSKSHHVIVKVFDWKKKIIIYVHMLEQSSVHSTVGSAQERG